MRKRILALFMVMLILCCYASPVVADTKYGVYGAITIIDTSNSTAEEKEKAVEAARKSKNLCTIIYSSAQQEYTVNSSVIWSSNYSQESFVNIVKKYQPDGSYSGTTGWKTFYQDFADEWYNVCTAYGMDPVFMICVSAWQTGFGTSRLANSCANLFGLSDYREPFFGDIAQRAMELLKVACQRYSARVTYGHSVYDLGTWIAPEDPEFSAGIARLMNKLFSELNLVTTIKIVGDFNRLECLPTYSSIK